MRSPRVVLAGLTGLVGVIALGSGCAMVVEAPVSPVSVSSRNVSASATFSDSGSAITYDREIVPAGARAAVSSRSSSSTTSVTLAVRGFAPDAQLGAHVHTAPCGAAGEDAGPHFQREVDPVQPSVDPAYANPANEVWLDLQLDETGSGTARSEVAWGFPDDRRPRSIVVHALPTRTGPGAAGTAGDRAACFTMPF